MYESMSIFVMCHLYHLSNLEKSSPTISFFLNAYLQTHKDKKIESRPHITLPHPHTHPLNLTFDTSCWAQSAQK